jgi:hypothetical protein
LVFQLSRFLCAATFDRITKEYIAPRVMITQTEGCSSQHLEFYHPDGIREIRMRLANFARMVIRVIREIRVLKK